MAKRIAVFLADGFEEIEAVTPIDLWRRAGMNVVTFGLAGTRVRGSHGIEITADAPFEDAEGELFDCVFLPGGPGVKGLSEDRRLGPIIQTHAAEGKVVAAICAAPARVLAPLGITSGKTVTGFPGTEEGFDESTMYTSRASETDGWVVTGKAAGKAADFAHAVLTALGHAAEADDAIRRTYFALEP